VVNVKITNVECRNNQLKNITTKCNKRNQTSLNPTSEIKKLCSEIISKSPGGILSEIK
jgi:hypothetical protein